MKKDDCREKLSEWLLQTDDDILDEAYRIDSAEQLKKRTEGEKTVRKTIHARNYAVRRIVAAALCMLVVCGVLFTVSALFKNDEPLVETSAADGEGGRDPSKPDDEGIDELSRPGGTNDRNPSKPDGEEASEPSKPDGTENSEPSKPDEGSQGTQSEVPPSGGSDIPNVVLPTGGLHIESIDMLNYYSAIRVLTSSQGNVFSTLSAGRGSTHGIRLLAAGEETPPFETTAPPPPEPEPLPQPPEVSEPSELPEIYYYELEPDAVFYIEKVSFFQIELTDETGFLASKLGTGVVDVVITEGFTDYYDDPMITFKNGDRYFSCLLNGGIRSDGSSYSYMEFSTHKYIEGFYIVKNFVQENYAFIVSIVDNQVEYFECANWDRGEHPDGVLPVVSKTYVSNESFSYTIAELEEYFNAGILPG